MPGVDRSILIEAPVATVFEYVADWRNTIKYQHQFSKFEPVGEPVRGLGLTVDARGWFKGLPVRARLRIVEFVENERIVSRSVAHMRSSAEWLFSPDGDRTRVRFIANYDWPVPLGNRLLKRIVENEIASMTETSLRDLKRLVEGQVKADAARCPTYGGSVAPDPQTGSPERSRNPGPARCEA